MTDASLPFPWSGSQGAKTVSQIVGTASFLEGFMAQDSLIYGAERRGAPAAALTRIAREPINERAIIVSSAIPQPRCLRGEDKHMVVFVNSPLSACPTGWLYDPGEIPEVTKLAVQTGL